MKKIRTPRKLKKEVCKIDRENDQRTLCIDHYPTSVKVQQPPDSHMFPRELIDRLNEHQHSQIERLRMFGHIEAYVPKGLGKHLDIGGDIDNIGSYIPGGEGFHKRMREYLAAEHKIIEENRLPTLKFKVNLTKEQAVELCKNWDSWANSCVPITHPESFTMISMSRSQRVHSHPRLEAVNNVDEDEVIVDKEFVGLFKTAIPISEDGEHWLVKKEEYMNILKTPMKDAAID